MHALMFIHENRHVGMVCTSKQAGIFLCFKLYVLVTITLPPHPSSCCTTQEERLPSCTYRGTVEPESEFYCPSPPRVSYQDALLGSPTGALDSEGTFIAEYLMRFAEGFDTATFFQRYQAGFTITTRDPPYTVCGCQNEVEETCQRAFQPFGEASPGEDCPHFEVNMQSPPDSCFICAVGCSIPGCSTVEGVAATTLQNNSCNACPQSNANNSVGAVFPTPDQPPIAVTVWYNNQVCMHE